MMGDILSVIGGAIVAGVALFALTLVGTLVGAFSGFVVGLFFTDTILLTLNKFGVDTYGLEIWQIGATLGFVGGFFRSSLSTESKN